MNAITERFKRRRVLLPVIHSVTPEQVRDQAEIAAEAGADGVFLINQGGMDSDDILAAAFWLGRAMPGFFVGINLLGQTPAELAHIVSAMKASYRDQISGLWADDAQADRWSARPPKDLAWKPMFFGGVAFKGQTIVHPDSWGRVAADAAGAGVDVVTTSGSATGKACRPEKVRAMRDALGDHALALASGIHIGNVDQFLPTVDAYLVASSIERRFGEFDPGAVRALADRIHEYGGPL